MPTIDLLERAIERHAHSAGDHVTALPALSLHRRNAQTEPVQCIYYLSLAVTVQGDKQVMLGDTVLDYGPGESMLTTIGVPIVSHVTRATMRELYLGLLLRLDVRSIALAVSEVKLSGSDEAAAPTPISIKRLDPALLDALRRLIEILDDPLLLPYLAPLIQARDHCSPVGGSPWPAPAEARGGGNSQPTNRRGRRLDQAELRRGNTRGRVGG